MRVILVKCGVTACPWRLQSGFCDKTFIFLTSSGACNWIYDERGGIKPNWQIKGKEKSGGNYNVQVHEAKQGDRD